jgi:DNA-binding transcriptional ArsR family regulator
MIITISGGNTSLRNLAHSLIEYCGAKLLSPTIRKSLIVDLEFSRTLYKEDGLLGEIDFNDSNHRPKEFTITVDCTVPKRRIMETIAHEMVHLKQYAKGELIDLERSGKTRWQKQIVTSQTNYWDLPWEIEAHGRELGLFVRWAEQLDLAQQDWTQEKLV